jgi:hypothetical protein
MEVMKMKTIKKGNKKEKWVKLGVVGVDSGRLMVCDPSYLGEERGLNKARDLSWEDEELDRSHQLNYKLGHPGLAVVFSSGLGDGLYDVLGRMKTYRCWGERISEVRIVLIKDNKRRLIEKSLKMR